MVDLLIPNIDAKTSTRLKCLARRGGVSVAELVRQILIEHLQPSRPALFAKLRAIRARQIVHGANSVALIRADRRRR